MPHPTAPIGTVITRCASSGCTRTTWSALIGAGIFAALASAADIGRRYAEAGGPGIPGLAPDRRLRARGDWATRALPFIFGALWLLALVAALGS